MIEQVFGADTASIHRARAFAVAAAGTVSSEEADVLALLVSELASNCVRHARSSYRLQVDRSPDQVRVQATDQGLGTPRMKDPSPSSASGRGLRIIDAFAGAWGVDGQRGGETTVWFTFPVVGVDRRDEGAEGTATPRAQRGRS